MTDKMRREFEAFCRERNYKYTPLSKSALYVRDAHVWEAATKATHERYSLAFKNIADKLESEMAKGQTLGELHNPFTIGQIDLLRRFQNAQIKKQKND